MRKLVWRRIRISAAYVGVWFVLMFLHQIFILPLAAIFFPRFRFWLYRGFISEFACPTCGKPVPMVGSWQCGCGFTQHRHAYQPCSKCKAFIVETSCPHCQHGVFM